MVAKTKIQLPNRKYSFRIGTIVVGFFGNCVHRCGLYGWCRCVIGDLPLSHEGVKLCGAKSTFLSRKEGL